MKDYWSQTYTGVQFWLLQPREDDIRISDIAHSLSLQCRFNGHCSRFYSVAEHSVRVSWHLPPELQLWGLLHDAAEAYLGDLVRPVKCQPEAKWYRDVEDNLLRCIAGRFDLIWPMPAKVKIADNTLLATEARDLMGPAPAPWAVLPEPLDHDIEPWDPKVVEQRFLDRFDELRNRR